LQNKFKNRLPQDEHPVHYNKVALKRKYEEPLQKESSDVANDSKGSDLSGLSIKRKKVLRTDEAIKVVPEKHDNV